MIKKICYWLLIKRLSWGDEIKKPFDKWLYKHS